MWYRIAVKYNIYGLPISGEPIVKQFAIDDDENIDISETPTIDNELEDVTPQDEIVTIEDPTPEDEFTTDDLENNVEILENDPTAMMKLPPLHENCRCVVETIPYLSDIFVNDGRRIWQKAQDCCPVCEKSALEFNRAEIIRLTNKIDKIIADRKQNRLNQ